MRTLSARHWLCLPTLVALAAVALPAAADAQEVPSGIIAGTITDELAVGEYHSHLVEAIDTASGEVAAEAWTDSVGDGRYELRGLPQGTYRVEFDRGWGEAESIGQYWNGVDESAGAAASDLIVIGAGERVDGIDAHLENGATITGSLTRTAPAPGSTCIVHADPVDPDLSSRWLEAGHDGSFQVSGLSLGDYQLHFREGSNGGCALDRQYVTATGDTSSDPADAALFPAGHTFARPIVYDEGAGTIVNTATPVITGEAAVGSTLTATDGSWSPAPDSVAHQWLANGEPIDGATGAALTLTPQHEGTVIDVVVTAAKEGYSAGIAMSEVGYYVGSGSIRNTAAPLIDDSTPEVGQLLTATAGTWSTSDLTTAFQWFANGAPIVGATHSTYEVAPRDLSRVLSVSVTASKDGYTSATAWSEQTAAIAPGTIHNTAAPVIDDPTPVVGQVLNATAGTWSTSGVTVAFQWFVNGKPITGATNATYKVMAHDVSRTLSVKVTATKVGYTSATASSQETSRVFLVLVPSLAS